MGGERSPSETIECLCTAVLAQDHAQLERLLRLVSPDTTTSLSGIVCPSPEETWPPGKRLSRERSNGKTTLLCAAILLDDPVAVRLLLTHPSVNVNANLRFEYEPPLYECVRKGGKNPGALECARLLLQHPEIEAAAIASSGLTVFSHACCMGDLEMFRLMYAVPEEAMVHVCDFDGARAFEMACCNGWVEIVREFLDRPGFDVEQYHDILQMLLQHLQKAEQATNPAGVDEVFCFLVAHPRINPNRAMADGQTILSAVCELKDLRSLRLLLAGPRRINTRIPIDRRLADRNLWNKEAYALLATYDQDLLYPADIAKKMGCEEEMGTLIAKYEADPDMVRTWLRAGMDQRFLNLSPAA